jgi:hypothetical protein
MTRPVQRNLAASVKARLAAQATAIEDVQHLLIQYALERLLYRLSQSRHAGAFTVKGALVFLVWNREPYRSTKDLDLATGRSPSPEEFAALFRELCQVEVEPDGLVFVGDSMQAREIREDNLYGGIRVTLLAMLGTARIPLQVDVGFGDAVTPPAKVAPFPTLLDMPAPRLRMYARETVVAEKFEILVQLGIVNSRMKDYYDLWVLAREFEFDGEILKDAIGATFRRRQTPLPEELPAGLAESFVNDSGKQAQWRGFLRRTRLRFKEPDLGKVVEVMKNFVVPPAQAAQQKKPFARRWPNGGPWQPK